MNLFALAGIIIAVAAASAGMLWLARRNPLNERFSSQLGEHGRAFDFLGIAFAILLGFVVLQAYDSYNDAKRGAELEAQGSLGAHAHSLGIHAAGTRPPGGDDGVLWAGGNRAGMAGDAGGRG